MKSKYVPLPENDPKGRAFVLESLSACAWHTLSRKLLERFATARGPMAAIIGGWVDLDSLSTYAQICDAPPGTPPYDAGYYPQDRLVEFVKEYLRATRDGVVVSEDWGLERAGIEKLLWAPPRLACYGDNEVFNIVTPDITDPDAIQAAVMERHHWQTNVCSSCARVPDGDIPSGAFFDEIVKNTKHIFVPALDGGGYLIWSPSLPAE